jgi:hypothetical protein
MICNSFNLQLTLKVVTLIKLFRSQGIDLDYLYGVIQIVMAGCNGSALRSNLTKWRCKTSNWKSFYQNLGGIN